MDKKVCPMCGKKFKHGSTICTCGYKINLSDSELSSQLVRYAKLSGVSIVLVVAAIAASIVVGIKAHRVEIGLSVGFVFLFAAAVWAKLMGKRQRRLVLEQLGQQFDTQAKSVFGPQLDDKSLGLNVDTIRDAGLSQVLWEKCEKDVERQGVYRNVHFSAANIRLIHVYKNRGQEGGFIDEKVFSGVWICCKTLRGPEKPLFIREREKDSSGEYVKGSFPSNMQTGFERFDRQFAVYAEDIDWARSELTDKFTACLERLPGTAEGRCELRFERGRMYAAISTDRIFSGLGGKVDIRNIDSLRQSFADSLKYMTDILDLLFENSSLFIADQTYNEHS